MSIRYVVDNKSGVQLLSQNEYCAPIVILSSSINCNDTNKSDGDDSVLFRRIAADNLSKLSQRQNDVLKLVLKGHASKNIAHELNLSRRTVENHRAAIAKRMGAHSLPELVHSAVSARYSASDQGLPQSADSSPQPQGLTKEEFIRLDMREVSHRVKNFAAVIQSICNQTARQVPDPSEFAVIFTARLSSYCRSLDALVAGSWSNMGMSELATLQLEPFGLLDCNQITLAGREIRLMPATAHAVGMALHELATNAVKYGALSVPVGQVAVDWRLEGLEQAQQVVLTWKESGGPRVKKPLNNGFGSQVIQRLTALALDGIVKHEFLPMGVEWELRISEKVLAH
jgi:two-component sensor histidine kinase